MPTRLTAILLLTACFLSVPSTRADLTQAGAAGPAALDPCASTAWMVGSPEWAVWCPLGDGDNFFIQPWVVWVRLVDANGQPMVGVPETDVWVLGCDGTLCACYPTNVAMEPTDATGVTYVDLRFLKAGGYDSGFRVVVLGQFLSDATCTEELCLPVGISSADINRDLVSNLADFTLFAQCYVNEYDRGCDLNVDGVINLVDFSYFAQHYTHLCSTGIPCP